MNKKKRNILEEIEAKDPLLIADDDHLNRKDLTEREALQAFKEIAKKLKPKKGPTMPSEFSKAIIESLNSIK